MNVYDLDHTIYPGDSTLDFWRFCVKRWPAALLPLPWAALSGGLFKAGLCARETFKGRFYRFLRRVPDVEGTVSDFWEDHIERIYPWYLDQRREDDLVISASPDFWSSPPAGPWGSGGSPLPCPRIREPFWAPTAGGRRRRSVWHRASPAKGWRASGRIPCLTPPWPVWRSGPIW